MVSETITFTSCKQHFINPTEIPCTSHDVLHSLHDAYHSRLPIDSRAPQPARKELGLLFNRALRGLLLAVLRATLSS